MSAISTVVATVIAAATPISVMNGIRTTDSPTRAMITVAPAKTTAEPAVPIERATASSTVRPSRSSVRNRARMNRP